MMDCGVALRDAGDNLDDVLAALHGGGKVTPPAGPWTWDDCAAQTPMYNADGVRASTIAALRCGNALFRRGSVQTPGPWGVGLQSLSAVFAADEAHAAALLSTEAQVDAVFAYRDEIGEPAPDALGRELDILAPTASVSRPRWPRCWRPRIRGPRLARGHQGPCRHGPGPPRAAGPDRRARPGHRGLVASGPTRRSKPRRRARRRPPRRDRLARRERRAVRAPQGRPRREIDLHALGQALASLRSAHGELAPGASLFGYPAAYVPIALGPEDIAKSRTNFEAVYDLAEDDVTQFDQVAADAWQKARDYEQKTHAVATTARRSRPTTTAEAARPVR
jgi:hypothetical protein